MGHAATVTPIKSLVIETGIPIPGYQTKSAGALTQAIRSLAAANVGDSLFIPAAVCSVGGQVSARAHTVGGKGWLVSRKCDGGFRVWKIAEPKLR